MRDDLTQYQVIILRGLPASGKTTWARKFCNEHSSYKRVSKDDLRQMFYDGTYSKHKERFVREARNALVAAALEGYLSVVVDDTNTNERNITEIEAIAKRHDAPVTILDFDTPLAECIRRDALRDKPVGKARIRDMYAQLCDARGVINDDPDLAAGMKSAVQSVEQLLSLDP